MPKTYITAISAYRDKQVKAQKAEEKRDLIWLRTAQTWSTFVDGLCAEVTEDITTFDAEMTKIRGDAWIPLVVERLGPGWLSIKTPVIVRNVQFNEETHRFKIRDLDVAGQYPEISQRYGDYYVEKPTDGAEFDVRFQDITTSEQVQSPARDIVQPLVRLFLK